MCYSWGMTSLKIGDTVTIRRGKLKGETGKVETVSGTQVVVRLTNGTLLLQNQINLKAPEEATIGASALAGLIQGVVSRDGDVREIVYVLDEALPGFSKSVDFPTAT